MRLMWGSKKFCRYYENEESFFSISPYAYGLLSIDKPDPPALPGGQGSLGGDVCKGSS